MLRRLLVFLALLVAACTHPEERSASGAEHLDLGVALPLHTDGRFIVDANGRRVKLVSANWYGAESPDLVPGGLDRADARTIAQRIHALGFNSVRLPWSNELVRRFRRTPDFRLADPPDAEPDPDVAVIAHKGLVSANDGFGDLHPLEIFDRVVSAITDEGLLVILDNHTSRADWCCDDWDGNGLWHRDDWNEENRYTENDWLDDWRFMADRYGDNACVIGAELRNEIRPAWGKSASWNEWASAAERGGDAVLSVAPQWLVFVGGLSWSTDLGGAYSRPVHLSIDHRLVYAPHDYGWFHPETWTLKTDLGNKWGYLLRRDETFTAPVWVSEIGTCDDGDGCLTGAWFEGILAYLRDADIDFAYWAVNATQSSQQPDSRRRASNKRQRGNLESYGLLAPDWTIAQDGTRAALVAKLMELRDAKESP